eukprot:9181277-Pyramimonas_sp.AAC.1
MRAPAIARCADGGTLPPGGVLWLAITSYYYPISLLRGDVRPRCHPEGGMRHPNNVGRGRGRAPTADTPAHR